VLRFTSPRPEAMHMSGADLRGRSRERVEIRCRPRGQYGLPQRRRSDFIVRLAGKQSLLVDYSWPRNA
jgi:hypothetical protein